MSLATPSVPPCPHPEYASKCKLASACCSSFTNQVLQKSMQVHRSLAFLMVHGWIRKNVYAECTVSRSHTQLLFASLQNTHMGNAPMETEHMDPEPWTSNPWLTNPEKKWFWKRPCLQTWCRAKSVTQSACPYASFRAPTR